jgi:hypothetical protein
MRMVTPRGDFPVAYEFNADGTTLTGSTMGPDGSPIPIKNGKIDGNKITFYGHVGLRRHGHRPQLHRRSVAG